MVAKGGKKSIKPKKKSTTSKLLKTVKAKSAQSHKNVASKSKKASKSIKSKSKTTVSVKVKQKAKLKSRVSTKGVAKSSKIKLVKSSYKPAKKEKGLFGKNSIPIIKKKLHSESYPDTLNGDLNFNLEKDHFHYHQNASESIDNNDIYEPSKFQPYHIDATEEYMNDQQLEHFANILNNWKQELMEEVDHTITEMKEADILADPNDRATQEETFNLELRTRDRERKLIKKIEAALNKIDEQQYGYCDSCGVEIGIRRLEARPTATLCIECKTLAEIKEKRS